MIHEMAIVVLIGGLVAVDTTAAFQTMISQPIAAGAIVGFALGDPASGVLVGALLQLVWIGAVPSGGAKFPDAGPATVAGAATAIFLQRMHGVEFNDACLSGILLAFPVAIVGSGLTVLIRKLNHPIARFAGSGNPREITLAVLGGIGVALVGGLTLTGIAILAGTALKDLPYSLVDSRAGIVATFGLGLASTFKLLSSKKPVLGVLSLGIAAGIVFQSLR